MEIILEKCRALFSSKAKIESHNEIRRHNYLEKIYKVLSWNDPFISWCSFIAVNYVFWLITWLELKLLGLMFLLVSVLFIYDYLYCFNGSSVNNVIYNNYHEIEEFIFILNLAFSNMCALRNENPSVFCLFMSIFFLMLSLIARSVSGMLLTYAIILGIFFLPLAYKNLPLQVKYGIKKTITSALSFQDIIAEDDLVPVQTCKLEGIYNWESIDTDKTAESVTNSLISGMSSMPSFMDAEDNDELLEEDLMPVTMSIKKGITSNVVDLSSDSDSDLRDMRFRESHISKDTSSDEGSKFEEGLSFSETTSDCKVTMPNKKTGLYDVISNSVSILSGSGIYLSNLMGATRSTEQISIPTRQNSSSESDFEIVNHEDVKH